MMTKCDVLSRIKSNGPFLGGHLRSRDKLKMYLLFHKTFGYQTFKYRGFRVRGSWLLSHEAT